MAMKAFDPPLKLTAPDSITILATDWARSDDGLVATLLATVPSANGATPSDQMEKNGHAAEATTVCRRVYLAKPEDIHAYAGDVLPTASEKERAALLMHMQGYVQTVEIAVRRKQPAKTTVGGYHLTDSGNADRLVDLHGCNWRWTQGLGDLVWEGDDEHGYWVRDRTREVQRMARATVEDMHAKAAAMTARKDALDKAHLEAHALLSESSARLRAMVENARSDKRVVVRDEDLDTHPFLLTVANGTVDLRTGRVEPARREHLITKRSPVRYDPDACRHEWTKFVHDITDGDEGLTRFLRQFAGYSLTGDTREEVLVLLHGPGGRGKTTLIRALQSAMGSYAQTTPFTTFLVKPGGDGVSNDVAKLAGARLVAAVEARKGRRLDEEMIKQITGGDEVSARLLYHDFFDFVPQLKLWLVANDAPRVPSTDTGLWRRVLRVPFNHPVPDAEKDLTLKNLLTDPARGGPAVLAWAVQGAIDWYGHGLVIPQVVRDSTAAYQRENDPLATFIDDYCILDPAVRDTTERLFTMYKSYAQSAGMEHPLTMNGFSKGLSAHGCSECRISLNGTQKRGWAGIALKPGVGFATFNVDMTPPGRNDDAR